MTEALFRDRYDAGDHLARILAKAKYEHPVVLGLARGGVPVAVPIAERMKAPLEVFVVRKIGAPHNPEYGIGALSEGGAVAFNEQAIRALGLTQSHLQPVIEREHAELRRRIDLYRGGRRLPNLRGTTIILVDDGLAKSLSAKAAVRALRA